MECVLIDNYENSGTHRREGHRVKRGLLQSFAGSKLRIRPLCLFSMTQRSPPPNSVAIKDFLGKIQRILCGAGMVRGPSGILSYPTSLSQTLPAALSLLD